MKIMIPIKICVDTQLFGESLLITLFHILETLLNKISSIFFLHNLMSARHSDK